MTPGSVLGTPALRVPEHPRSYAYDDAEDEATTPVAGRPKTASRVEHVNTTPVLGAPKTVSKTAGASKSQAGVHHTATKANQQSEDNLCCFSEDSL